MVALRWGSLTDVGRSRSLNEDAIVAEFPVFAVADGMGGHAAGEVASQLTADHLADLGMDGNPTGERLVSTIRAANNAIFRKSLADPMLRGMGTTVCALSLVGERLSIVNVGDSRVYTVRDGRFSQVSHDHSYVAELVDAGEITWAQARSHPNRNIVTRALGIEPDIDVDLWEVPAIVGDRFLLCSDGLVDEVVDDAIAELLNHFPDPQQAAEELVRLANHNGGHDNISVVIVDVIDGLHNQPPLDTTTRLTDASMTTGPVTGSTRAVPQFPQPLVIEPHQPGYQPDHDDTAATVGNAAGAVTGGVTRGGRSRRASGTTTDTSATADAGTGERTNAPRLKPATGRRVWANRIRAFVFTAVILGIIGTIIGGVQFYGNAGTHVGFQGDQVTVFKGRVGGVLWVHPSVLTKTPLTKTKLSADAVDRISKTVSFTDRAAAIAWIDALSKNPTLAPGNMPATTTTAPTTTTTTATTTTVAPASTTSTTAGP